VAVYYSHESVNAGGVGLGGDAAAGQRWLATVNRETSFCGTYLTREKLLAGGHGLRVLAFPQISSLSDEEIAAIRTFMEQGGFVLGDDTLGVADQYLRRRTDLASLSALRKHANYVPLAQVSDAAAIDRFLRQRVGLTPSSNVSKVAGGTPGLRIGTFRNGPLTYTVTGANGGVKPLRLALAAADSAWVYNSRTGAVLGRGRVEFDLPPAESAVLAQIPYRVSAVDLRVPEGVAKGDELAIAAQVKADGTPGAHVLALTVTDPAGQTAIPSRWRVATNDGIAATKFFVPFNARSGAWQIEVRDAATGVKNAASFSVP
jgi:hypothetical protein